MKPYWRSRLAFAGGALIGCAAATAALGQEMAGEAARGAAGAINGGSGDVGAVIVVGVLLYSGIFIVSGLLKFFAGILHRDKREVSQGLEGVSGGLGCLLVGAIVVGALVIVNHLLFGHGR